MIYRQDISSGMPVYSRDGARLGKVAALDEEGFRVEKGFFFPKDYLARYADVGEVRDGSLYLLRDADWFRSTAFNPLSAKTPEPREVVDQPFESKADAIHDKIDTRVEERRIAKEKDEAKVEDRSSLKEKIEAKLEERRISKEDLGTKAEAIGAKTDERDSVTMPLMAEELEIRKRPVKKGEVSLHKKIATETRTVDVPLRREVAHLEHIAAVPADAGRSAHAFEEETMSIPLEGEEVEIVKKAVVREEVRLSKSAIEEQQHLSENLRHEEVELLKSGDNLIDEKSPSSTPEGYSH